MTLTGKLDFEGDTARIEGDSQASRKMLPAAAKWCADRLKKGMIVDAELVPDGDKHGWISKIYEHKQEEKKDCTSTSTPAGAGLNPDVRSGPKKIEGEIIAIDPGKRTMALRSLDEKGYEITTLFVWREARDLDQTAQKQKPGWYVCATYEAQGDRNLMIDVRYADRPANMRRQGGNGGNRGGRQFQPRNERLILFQNMHTAALNGAMHATTPDSQDYDEFMDMVYVRAKKDTDQAMKDFSGGV